MKRKLISIICVAAVITMLSGCGTTTAAPATGDGTAQTEETKPAESTSAEETTSEGGDVARPAEDFATLCYEFEEELNYEEEGGIAFTKRYVLDIQDDKNAILTESSIYSDNYQVSTIYKGEFTIGKDSVEFIYQPVDDEDGFTRFEFKTSGDTVTEVLTDYVDKRVMTIAGKYTGNDDTFGKMTLDVRDNGGARLIDGNGTEYTGSVIVVDGKYDLMVSTDDNTASLDWYIFLSGSSFTYVPYGEGYAENSPLEGTYHLFGMLGECDLRVDASNNGTLTLVVDGEEKQFTGYVYTSERDTDVMGGSYMNSEDGYTLDLSFMYIESEGMWNYSGYLNTPLGAG